MRRVAVGLVLAIVAAGCSGGDRSARVGGDAGALEAVDPSQSQSSTGPGTAPSPPSTPGPEASPGPSATAQPSPQPSQAPSQDPSAGPSQQPSPQPSEPVDPPPVVEDLDLDGWQVRIVGLIDPARADEINRFAQRPVVAVTHVQADELPEDGDGDAAAVVSRLGMAAELDSGEVVASLPAVTGANTIECPAHIDQRVVLRPGQGQRLCAVFDVPATAEVVALRLDAEGQRARVSASDLDRVDRIDAIAALDVGVPEGVVALGRAVTVTVPVASSGSGRATARVDMAVTDVTITTTTTTTDDDHQVVELTVQVVAPEPVTMGRLSADALVAISAAGTQRGQRADVNTDSCQRAAAIDLAAGEPSTFCVPVRVPENSITSNARYTTADGPPVVWRVLQAGGTAGPGSNA